MRDLAALLLAGPLTLVGCLLVLLVPLAFYALIAWAFQQLIFLAFGVEPAFWPLLCLLVLVHLIFGARQS